MDARLDQIRRNNIKNVCEVRDPVLNLTHDKVIGAYTLIGEEFEADYIEQVKDIKELFQLPKDIRKGLARNTLSLPYDDSWFKGYSWFTMSMCRVEKNFNVALDVDNKFIKNLIEKSFTNEIDKTRCYQEPIIKQLMNPLQTFNRSTLMQQHRDIIITCSEEIPNDEISRECNEVIKRISEVEHSDEEIIKMNKLVSRLWQSHSYEEEHDKFNDIIKEINQATIENKEFQDKDAETKKEIISFLCRTKLSVADELKNITPKIVELLDLVNQAMGVGLQTNLIEIVEESSIKNSRSLSSDDPSEYGKSAIDIRLRSSENQEIIVIERKRLKTLRSKFLEFLAASKDQQIKKKELKIIGNMVKQALTYVKEGLGKTTAVLTNLNTLIILEADISKSNIVKIKNKCFFDIKLRYKIIDYEAQKISFRYGILYLLSIVKKPSDTTKEKRMKEFEKFQISDSEKFDSESETFSENVSEKSNDESESQTLESSKLLPNGTKNHSMQYGYRYNSNVFSIKYRDVSESLGYEFDGVALEDDLILKLYQSDLYQFDPIEDQLKFSSYLKEIQALEYINKYNSEIYPKQGIHHRAESGVLNVPKIYKHLILNLTNPITGLSDQHGYAIIMSKIEGNIISSLDQGLANESIKKKLEKQTSIMENIGISHNDLAPRNIILNPQNQLLYILDWGCSTIKELNSNRSVVSIGDDAYSASIPSSMSSCDVSQSPLFSANTGRGQFSMTSTSYNDDVVDDDKNN
ncbi:hypothetical protein BN7_2768 [Wickerhamomyces ciferrii]|uniref:non-specific serine/threonine protein kinase n=1 Tax=Wickerhamomyces ciferrii (strain ATCC 14091 / BCRC 22168 / CBS 111 / JCM 3599 / NBRC 0793 / NRRL Y-1031 F-60-10) TaxID=1206466 RepID=K0KJV1_WICCF|nr:uncharacterized protein BN7_2768 [Wickerhamomyces ciferrii]CCH43221.1 hypothetical protein BN7_2768 [Wickerhamomyces ciferrii]